MEIIKSFQNKHNEIAGVFKLRKENGFYVWVWDPRLSFCDYPVITDNINPYCFTFIFKEWHLGEGDV